MHFFYPFLDKEIIVKEYSAHFFSSRVKIGETVKICDLQGKRARVKILEIDKAKKGLNYEILSTEIQTISTPRSLIQAIPDKLYVEKMMEVLPLSKIKKIYLFFSDFSPKFNLNLERLDKILIRSCEQGEVFFKPEIHLLQNKSELFELLRQNKTAVLDTQAKQSQSKLSSFNSFLIGPEGGWSKQETETWQKLDLAKIYLGEIILPAWLTGFRAFVE